MDGNRKKPIALIVDDEESICQSLGGVLEDEGWAVRSAMDGRRGLIEYKVNRPDIVFLDVWMPGGMDGIETLQSMKQIQSDTPIIIMSGHATIETAVRATKLGALEFLEKPLSLEKILPLIEHAKALGAKSKKVSKGSIGERLIGDSEFISKIKSQMSKVAPRNAWVLITGENGTGKEVLARSIHINSARSEQPFVAVNCAAIPETLIESELFGHVKGAFTGASSSQRGKFELANKGTLFLDEIGDMSLRTQAKILRVVQEQVFERLGGEEPISVDVRVIAATNKNLAEEIKLGSFREDLFYRLNVIPFHMMPLRDRGKDIEKLINHFLEKMSVELGEKPKSVSPEAMAFLLGYRWPGNVRELRNMVERLCIMTTSEQIAPSDLPASIKQGQKSLVSSPSDSGSTLKEAKSDFERSFILDKLEENQWNVSKTAEAIGVERSNLHRKLRAYGIDSRQIKG